MNKKILLLLLVFSLTLAGCQKTEETDDTNNNDDGTISVQPINNDNMSTVDEENDSMEEESTEAMEETNTPTTKPTTIVVEKNPLEGSRNCEVDADCVAIPHPDNSCFIGYFNKNAYEAMDYWRANEDVSAEGCPNFGVPVCINNSCIGKK